MCTNCRYIYNHYSRRKVLVKCGKCDACKQEKACARTNRIRNNMRPGEICLFVTLTYTNDFIPYILRSDLSSSSPDINVYRNCSGRFTYGKKNGLRFKKHLGQSIVDKVYVPFENRYDGSLFSLKGINGLGKDKIAVCLNSDFQKFIKRLKQILIRNYNYGKTFSYFYCSEYGAHTHRSHFHTLIYIPADKEDIFKSAILKAWPYADSHRTEKYIELARDAASYVSSYVNSHFDVSSPLQVSKFKSKHNYSRGFGTFLDCFQLPALLEKIQHRDLHYYSAKKFDGNSSITSLPIPKYVINRYFPKFKGYSSLLPGTLEQLLLCPESAGDFLGDTKYFVNHTVGSKSWVIPVERQSLISNPLYNFSPSETYRIYVRLRNAKNYFKKVTGLSDLDYVYYYKQAWKILSLQAYKDSFDNVESISDFSDFYENYYDVLFNGFRSPTLESLDLDFCLDPNERKDIIIKSLNMVDVYSKLDKEKKVVNYVMACNGHNV